MRQLRRILVARVATLMVSKGGRGRRMTRYPLACRRLLVFLFVISFTFLCVPIGASAKYKRLKTRSNQYKWWNVAPEDEVPSPYYDSILYSEIAPLLREIEKSSGRLRVREIGKSSEGRDLFLVVIAARGEDGRFGHYRALRRMMIRDPEKVLEKAEMDDLIMLSCGHKDAFMGKSVYSPIGMVIAIAKKNEVIIIAFMIFDIVDQGWS